ncbi:MAG: nicotinate-nucleotide--dimethylbenzimidazole phosphoribosyltransferase [Bacteroidota bacterium]|nr:nicotinate-nucleotide--dimethylbenzimidazole phosphoribosyltransferase [Bacteroidota bacterium]
MNSLTAQLKHKIDNKTKPLGALGTLEDIALKVGTIQNTLSPVLKNPTIIVFAGDHGLVDEGVSPYPKAVTQQMVFNFLNEGAAINVFCKLNNIKLLVADAGIDAEFDESLPLIHAKIGKGTKNILNQPAMSSDECIKAIATGSEIVFQQHEKGCNIIGFGEMGIGNTSSASLLMSKFCNLPIEKCVGRGTGLDDEGLTRKVSILKQAIEKHPDALIPTEILSTFGGFEIVMMTGAMLKAAELGMVLMIDGFIATSAVLSAYHFNKHILNNCIFCHQSDEQGHKLMLDYLNVKPLINLNLRLGEGTGAAVAYPIIKAAVSFLNEMASFESAGVSKA